MGSLFSNDFFNKVKRTLNVETKNYIVNGGFDFWQRGTSNSFSTTSTVSGVQLADRFKLFGAQASTKTFNLEKSAELPNDLKGGNSYKLTMTNSATPTGDDALLYGIQAIEYNIIQEIYGKNFVYSFYFKSNVVGTHYLYFSNPLPNRLKVVSFEVTQADTWERHKIATDWDSSPTNTGVNSAIQVGFIARTNGNFADHPQEGTWEDRTGGLSITVNPINYAVSGNYFQVAGVMLYEDTGQDIDVPFQRAGRNYAEELQLCQRYYQRLETTSGTYPVGTGYVVSTTSVRGYIPTAVTMRDLPMINLISGNPTVYSNGGAYGVSSITPNLVKPAGINCTYTVSATAPVNHVAVLALGGDVIDLDAEI
jgi:hypothetical protein